MAQTALGDGRSPAQLARARGRTSRRIAMFGPAFVAAIAYVDPGNFATNVAGGAQFGYALLWVVVVANLVAMPIQYLSAKLGIVTGQSLPAVCRRRFPRPVTYALWVQAELVAMATDLAEFVGAALGLYLLFGIPALPAGVITAVAAFAILGLQRKGYRRFELALCGLLTLIGLAFVYTTIKTGPSVTASVGGLLPSFAGRDSVLLAAGIVGATVMPHAIYVHSALTSTRMEPRDVGESARLLRFTRADVGTALGFAGLINVSMLLGAAALFSEAAPHAQTIGTMHAELGRLVGGGAALAFAVALLASGISSSSVGTYAGQIVMEGFLRRRVSLVLRRALTMIPALLVLATGIDPTRALVLSQVFLSFGIPFALIPLLVVTSRTDVMGRFVNRRGFFALLVPITLCVISLNAAALYVQFF